MCIQGTWAGALIIQAVADAGALIIQAVAYYVHICSLFLYYYYY